MNNCPKPGYCSGNMTETRKEVPTQSDIHEQVKYLTTSIKHAKIECEEDKLKSKFSSSVDDARLLSDLNSLQTVIREYILALEERSLAARKVSFADRDSGISLDRSSGALRDSIPIQESGDFCALSGLAIASGPREHSEDIHTNIDELSSLERERMDRYEHYRDGRRTTNERRKIESISEKDEK